MFKSLIAMFSVCIMLFGMPAFAEIRTFDVDVMSVDELDALLDDVRAEKKTAVEFPNRAFELLKTDFMSTVESLAPEAVKFDYPFFGLNRDRERTYYSISGSVTAEYADETEQEFRDATVVYWHDVETDTFHQVALYTRNAVYFVKPELLGNIERYVDNIVFSKLYEHAVQSGLLSSTAATEVEPTPTPSPTPTPNLTPTPITTPTKEPTVAPTATADPFEQYEELKPGSKGQAVLDARMRMYELGYFKNKPTQTEYTRNMMDYVKEFEKDYGLEQDGILSPEDQVVLFGQSDSSSVSTTILAPTATPSMTVKMYAGELGELIFFGSYEQDGNVENGAERIEWKVIKVSGGKSLLLSKYSLENRPYHSSRSSVTWEKSSLRKWLNNTFIKSAFTSKEQKIIQSTKLSTENSYGTGSTFLADGGRDTTDKVFVLSVEEVRSLRYDFSNLGFLNTKPTKHARDQGAYIDDTGYCWWWLRTPGASQSMAAISQDNKYGSLEVEETGVVVDSPGTSVRPSIWVDTALLNEYLQGK